MAAGSRRRLGLGAGEARQKGATGSVQAAGVGHVGPRASRLFFLGAAHLTFVVDTKSWRREHRRASSRNIGAQTHEKESKRGIKLV